MLSAKLDRITYSFLTLVVRDTFDIYIEVLFLVYKFFTPFFNTFSLANFEEIAKFRLFCNKATITTHLYSHCGTSDYENKVLNPLLHSIFRVQLETRRIDQ